MYILDQHCGTIDANDVRKGPAVSLATIIRAWLMLRCGNERRVINAPIADGLRGEVASVAQTHRSAVDVKRGQGDGHDAWNWGR